MFAALSINQAYFAERINFFGALAPITSLKNLMPWYLPKFVQGLVLEAMVVARELGLNEVKGPSWTES